MRKLKSKEAVDIFRTLNEKRKLSKFDTFRTLREMISNLPNKFVKMARTTGNMMDSRKTIAKSYKKKKMVESHDCSRDMVHRRMLNCI